MQVSDVALHAFIVSELRVLRPDLDTQTLSSSTDLVEFGVESLLVLQLLAQIEKKFQLSLTLENLEKCDFKISVETILGDLNAQS